MTTPIGLLGFVRLALALVAFVLAVLFAVYVFAGLIQYSVVG